MSRESKDATAVDQHQLATPRPWRMEREEMDGAQRLNIRRDGWYICEVFEDVTSANGEDEQEANAELICRAVNQSAGVEALILAATFARNRLLQDSGDQESINKLNAALAQVAKLRGEP